MLVSAMTAESWEPLMSKSERIGLERTVPPSIQTNLPAKPTNSRIHSPQSRSVMRTCHSCGGVAFFPNKTCLRCSSEQQEQSVEAPSSSQPSNDSGPKLIFAEEPPVPWSCRFCTLHNSPTTRICQACGNNRPPFRMLDENVNQEEEHTPTHSRSGTSLDDLEDDEKRMGANATIPDFQISLQAVLTLSPDPRHSVRALKALLKICRRLTNPNPKYRSLDVRSPGVQDRLLHFEGTLEFLHLLGFQLNDNMKLKCIHHPPQIVMNNLVALVQSQLERVQKQVTRGFTGQPSIFQSKSFSPPVSPPSTKLRISRKVHSSEYAGSTPGYSPGTDISIEEFKIDYDMSPVGENFTLTQLVILITHESYEEEEAGRLVLLCHKCFSTSLHLLNQLIFRYFTSRERIVQRKVMGLLHDWINNYWEMDFVHQEDVQRRIETFIGELERRSTMNPDEPTWFIACAKTLRATTQNAARVVDCEEKAFIMEPPPQLIKRRQSWCRFSADLFAQQLTLRDFQLFARIHPREFLNKMLKKPDGHPYLTAMIDRFNKVSDYVAICIFSAPNLEERSEMIHYFIRVARKLLALRNYSSAVAVVAQLANIYVERLKYAWKRVQEDEENYRLFLDMKALCCSNDRNFAALRDRLKKPRPPTIPHVGLILSDLTFVNGAVRGDDEHYAEFINFKKFERFDERCRFVKLLQQTGYRNISADIPVQQEIEYNLTMSPRLADRNLRALRRQANDLDSQEATLAEKRLLETPKGRRKRSSIWSSAS